jgi:polysaccharide chain length determinant protein (PEP-CTERM system associated)
MRPLTPEDYVDIWSRRKWWFLAAIFIITAGTSIVAAMLPKMYTSESLILLEGQPVNSDAASNAPKPAGDAGTEQQLSTLIQQTLSRTRLEQIMQDVGYLSPTDKDPDGKADEFRSNISVNILKDSDPRHASAPYGFKISYSDHKPKNAQRVTNELASFFISERLKSQQQTAEESNQYLQGQLDSAAKDVTEKQQALDDFKQRYIGQLPVDEQLSVQSIMRLQTQLQVNQQSMERAREEEAAVENPTQTTGSTAQPGGPVDSATAKLSTDLGALQSKLADLLSRDTPTHPDVIKTQAEIAHVKAELASEQAATAAKTTDANGKVTTANSSLSNANSVAKLKDAKAEITSRTEEAKRIQAELDRYQTNLQQIPFRSQQYSELDRSLEDSKTAFEAMKKKVGDAQLTNDMEIRLQGQRFRIQDFASLPTDPATPVYWKINLGGLGAALLFGIVLAGAIEFSDSTMKSDRDVEYYLQTKNLATVPVLALPGEGEKGRMKRRLWTIVGIVTVVVMLGSIGYLYLIRM